MEMAMIMIGCGLLYRNMALVKEQLTRVNLQFAASFFVLSNYVNLMGAVITTHGNSAGSSESGPTNVS